MEVLRREKTASSLGQDMVISRAGWRAAHLKQCNVKQGSKRKVIPKSRGHECCHYNKQMQLSC